MKIDLKTIKGVTFSVEAAPDMLVGKVKELAASSDIGTKDGWEAEGMKLIFQGKVLDNSCDLASYSIKEGDFMVVMASKPKKPAAVPAPAPAPAPVPAPAPPASTPTPAPAPAPSPAPAPEAAPPAEFAPEHAASIQSLCDMGFPREMVIAAMRAAFMNADRAVEYLTNGIPEELADGGDGMDVEGGGDGEGEGDTPTTWDELSRSPAFLAEVAAVRSAAEPQAALQTYLGQMRESNPQQLALIQDNASAFANILNGTAPALAPATPAGGPLPFGNAASDGEGGGAAAAAGLQAMLQQRPEMLEGLLQNPEALQQLLQSPEVQQMLQSPEVQEQLGLTPEMMAAMLGGLGGMGGGGGGGLMGAVQAQLTDEDEEAIQRLMALGFQRAIVIQAFLACDKNENLAANFLFDQGNDLM